MAGEIRSILGGRLGGEDKLSEIRIIAEGRCCLIHNKETLALCYSPTLEESEDILNKACSGGVYAFRDTVRCGFVPMGDGVRLGVSGTASYDEGRLIGVSRIRSLIFRFPYYNCDFEDKLIRIYRRGICRGMLIYSPPAIGKTTALRTLARIISREKRLSIIDERGEFDTGRFTAASVLSGYEKALGIEIALRTHSPEIIIVDELGSGEAEALSDVLGAGIPIIATAHGGSVGDLLTRSATSSLIKAGFFDVFVGISQKGGKYRLKRNVLSEVFPKAEEG
jgi:stage III sporulation protein AA